MQQTKKQPSDASVAASVECEKYDNPVCQSLIDEESNIINWLHLCASHGLIITFEYFFEEILNSVQVSTHGQISRDEVEQWVDGFRRRWADRLRAGPAGPLLADRPSPRSGALWYRTVSAAIANRYPAVPFAEPGRLLFLGEMNLQLDSHSAAVRRLRSEQEAAAACRDNAAFVMAVSASGEAAPPMLVTPPGGLVRGDLLPQDDCLHQTTSNGTVTPDALRRYVVECLEPHLMARRVPRPLLVYLDGHHHRGSRALSRFCDAAGLILVGLPPGAAARSPLRGSVLQLLAGNLARLADGVQRGRRPEPGGGCSTSARALLTGFRAATRRATPESIAHAFQWSGLTPWSESIISVCDLGPLAPELAEVELGPPAPPPLPAPVGLPIPPAGLELEQTVRLLLSPGPQPPPLEPSELPRPGAHSAAFLVNLGDRLRVRSQPLLDGDGWTVSSTCQQTYLINDSVFERVHRNSEGRFCVRECVKEAVESRLTPSDVIVEVQWVRSTWLNNAGCTRRVTFISGCHSGEVRLPAVALYEFYPEGEEPRPAFVNPSSQESLVELPAGIHGTVKVTESRTEPTADIVVPVSTPPTVSATPAQLSTLQIPASGLPADRLIGLLLDPSRHGPVFRRAPLDKPNNTAYLINNESNRERRWRGLPCRYVDGPQQWEGGVSQPGRLLTYLLTGGRARRVWGQPGRYRSRERRDGRWVSAPLEPPPSGAETEVRLWQAVSRQLGGPLRRRISWVDRCEPPPQQLPAVALYEHMCGPGAEAALMTDSEAEVGGVSGPESDGEPRDKRVKVALERPGDTVYVNLKQEEG